MEFQKNMDQPKVVRLLRVMAYLGGTSLKSVGYIARQLYCSERTVYRYMDSLRDVGYAIVKRHGTTFQMVSVPDEFTNPKQYLCFTEEEAAILGRLIHCLDNNNPQKEVLLRKISAIYDAADLHRMTIHSGLGQVLEDLDKAIEGRRVVLLKGYASASSGKRKDYRVEPYKMDMNSVNVAAYDLECSCNKVFKIARIDSVEILPELWTKEKEHRYPQMDAFRLSGETPIHVRLSMTLRARNLMVEEYPLTENDITEGEGGRWIYDGTVRRMEGIGRFVMGLLSQIEILEGEELRQYVLESIRGQWERYSLPLEH